MIEPFFNTTVEINKKDYGKFSIEPLPQGFGHTLGNSLRRVLLTFLPGTAITSVKIKGVRHQFSTIPGLKEDIVEFILNLKNIHFNLEGDTEAKIILTKTGPGEILASDIKLPANVTIANPDVYLGTLANRDAKVDITFFLEQGTGFTPADERKSLIKVSASSVKWVLILTGTMKRDCCCLLIKTRRPVPKRPNFNFFSTEPDRLLVPPGKNKL